MRCVDWEHLVFTFIKTWKTIFFNKSLIYFRPFFTLKIQYENFIQLVLYCLHGFFGQITSALKFRNYKSIAIPKCYPQNLIERKSYSYLFHLLLRCYFGIVNGISWNRFFWFSNLGVGIGIGIGKAMDLYSWNFKVIQITWFCPTIWNILINILKQFCFHKGVVKRCYIKHYDRWNETL